VPTILPVRCHESSLYRDKNIVSDDENLANSCKEKDNNCETLLFDFAMGYDVMAPARAGRRVGCRIFNLDRRSYFGLLSPPQAGISSTSSKM